MTREEFRDYVEFLRSQDEISYDVYSGLIDGIDVLEQEPCDDWYDVPSDGMTLEQARQAVKDLRKKLAAYLDQDPGEDAISRQAVLDINESHHGQMPNHINHQIWQEIKDLKPVNPQPKTGWIPMTMRFMTEEEREHYREWSDVEGAMIFDCELPEDGQEVLVSYGGYVCVDTFCKDDGCYFDGVDVDDVQAWMPLPEPYKVVSEDKE